MHGQFVWYELMTSNSAGAKGFYPAVAGWGTEDWPHSPYTMWTSGGVPLGGIVQLRPDQLQMGMRSAWMPYIESGDVDETARKAAFLGGRVLFGPKDIPGTARFAVLADPQGAVFAIYHSLSPAEGFDGDPIPGRFSWHELVTTDVARALDFYRRVFGWEAIDSGQTDAGPYQLYGIKGKAFGGMLNRTPDMGSMPPSWLCYIAVPDLQKSMLAAKRGGGRILNKPMKVPGGGQVVILNDPQGAMFALFQPPPAGADGQRSSRRSGRGRAGSGTRKIGRKNTKTTAVKARTKRSPTPKRGTARKMKAKTGKQTRRRMARKKNSKK